MTLREELKSFILQGNVIQLAVAFVIGAAFTAVVTAFVSGLLTPLIGVVGHLDLSGWTFTVNHSTFAPGLFLNALLSFVAVALVVFFAVVRPIAKYEERRKARQAQGPATTKECPFCCSKIDLRANRCAFCT